MVSLIEWYNGSKRNLPWRETTNPYNIWLSEIILQQTRVAQGLAYYQKFIEKYPDVKALSEAETDEVLKMWEGLGYYSRARNLLTAARQVMEYYGGRFPESFEELKKIKGIGDYTAAAIASISFGIPVPVVDGNVYRVLSRLYAIDEPINSGKAKKLFFELAGELLDKNNPANHNQAIMELGALICTPKNPQCQICPIAVKCMACSSGTVLSFPVKSKPLAKTIRFFYYYIIGDGKQFVLQKREKADIWHNLYEFPLFESAERLTDEQILKADLVSEYISQQAVKDLKISKEIKHVLSHQTIYARFVHLKIETISIPKFHECFIVPVENLNKYAMPRLITRYLAGDVLV
jgi:A/G-specific adenine glycosylase